MGAFTVSLKAGGDEKRGLDVPDTIFPIYGIPLLDTQAKNARGGFGFHTKCEGAGITHLAFADDLLLSGRDDLPSMSILSDSLMEFKRTSGLAVSANKSLIFFSNVHGFTKELILEKFGFPKGTLPPASKSLIISQFLPLIERILNQINKWNNSYLSFVGRTELVHSVV